MLEALKSISLAEWLTIIAIVAGPFIGVYGYGRVEDRKKTYHRKLEIFKTLMASRAAALSPEHVRALNLIDVEFTAETEQGVRDAWNAYHAHLSTAKPPPPAPAPNATAAEHEAYAELFREYQTMDVAWGETTRERLAALLFEMSKLFGYTFGEERIRIAAYRPQRHVDIENAQVYLLTVMGHVFGGRAFLPMQVTNWPPPTEDQQELAAGITKALDEGVPIRKVDGR